jgi:hypothetical protein
MKVGVIYRLGHGAAGWPVKVVKLTKTRVVFENLEAREGHAAGFQSWLSRRDFTSCATVEGVVLP